MSDRQSDKRHEQPQSGGLLRFFRRTAARQGEGRAPRHEADDPRVRQGHRLGAADRPGAAAVPVPGLPHPHRLHARDPADRRLPVRQQVPLRGQDPRPHPHRQGHAGRRAAGAEAAGPAPAAAGRHHRLRVPAGPEPGLHQALRGGGRRHGGGARRRALRQRRDLRVATSATGTATTAACPAGPTPRAAPRPGPRRTRPPTCATRATASWPWERGVPDPYVVPAGTHLHDGRQPLQQHGQPLLGPAGHGPDQGQGAVHLLVVGQRRAHLPRVSRHGAT